MNDEEFREEMQQKIFDLLIIDNGKDENCYDLIDESIKFGRDNPETCQIERNESNMQMCRECGHFIGQPQWDLKENGIRFCNGCGRKINYEK